MRFRFFIILLAVTVLGAMLSAAGALAAVPTVENTDCDTLGATAMADNHGAILSCVLKNANGAMTCKNPSSSTSLCAWKAMSGGDGPDGSLCGLAAFGIDTAVMSACSIPGGEPDGYATCYGSKLVLNIPCKGSVIVNPLNYAMSCPSGYFLTSAATGGDPSGTYGNSIITCVRGSPPAAAPPTPSTDTWPPSSRHPRG